MKRTTDLLFFNIFVLLNAMFAWLPATVSLANWLIAGICTGAISLRLRAALLAATLDIPSRLILTEPHAAP